MPLNKKQKRMIEKLKDYDKGISLKKKRVNLTIDGEVLEKARKRIPNLSKYVENVLRGER